MKISVFGLGYVGAVSAACLGRDGHDVVGVDIDQEKLDLIASGKSPIIEAGIVDLMRDVVQAGRVRVTNSAADAIAETELSFVCVGTPSQPNGSQSLDALTRSIEQIGEALKSKSGAHTVVVRSTVQPGTMEAIVVPLLEEKSGRKCGEALSVCFQPEFLREGSSIKDYDNPPMTVVGVEQNGSGDAVRDLFGHLSCSYFETDLRTAETLKYGCNAFHALKVTFANEMGRICQALGSDSKRVMELLCEDTQLNISKAYLRPGFAFGGSCLPKDLKALLYLAKMQDVDVPMLSGLLPSNQLHVDHALETILARRIRDVGVIGLSFKSGTDDLRESPLVTLVERMIGKGLNVRIHDAEVRVSRLMGANKRYIDEVIPHIGSLMCESVEEAIDGAGIVVIGNSDADAVSRLCEHGTADQLFLDLAGIPEPGRLQGEYQGICW